MLKKENRLKSKAAFTATYKNRLILSDCYIQLYAGKEKEDKNCPTRVGFVVSKKIHKRAVVRNRIKRLLRENIRLILLDNTNRETQIINKYLSLIFVARSDIISLNKEQIEISVKQLIDKLANK